VLDLFFIHSLFLRFCAHHFLLPHVFPFHFVDSLLFFECLSDLLLMTIRVLSVSYLFLNTQAALLLVSSKNVTIVGFIAAVFVTDFDRKKKVTTRIIWDRLL